MAKEQERADIKARRESWRQAQRRWDPDKLVLVDESGAKTNMTRLRGRALNGARLIDRTPHGHWSTTTLIGSLRSDGTSTCLAVDGSTDRLVFREYVRQVLAPSLQPGDVVVLDNLSAHNDPETHRLIEAAGAYLQFLPPYSPDLNPIEQMWSKVKARLRAAKARSQEDLFVAIGAALKTVTSQDARAWFCHAGYTASQP